MGASLGVLVRVAAVGLAWGLLGCGDDDVQPIDAGVDGGVQRDGGEVDAGPLRGPTAAPALPRFTPCPDGWREVAVASSFEPTVCDPWPETGRETCGVGEMHLPGMPGCVSIAGACPPSGFPDDLPTDVVVIYVRAGATSGDGTEGSPYATISEAVTAASDGALIAVAPGTYAENLRIDKPLTLRGACGEVVVRGTNVTGSIVVQGASEVVIERVTVEGAEGIWVLGGAEVTLDSLEVRSVDGTCVRSVSSVITGRRLALRDCEAALSPLEGTIDVREVVIERVQTTPLRHEGGTLRVTDASVAGSLRSGSLLLVSRGQAELRRMVVESEVAEDVIAIGADASVVFEDFVFVGPPPTAAIAPMTLIALGEASFTLSRVRLERMRSLGLAVADHGSSLVATDVLIRDTLSETGPSVGAGHGLEVGGGATAEVDRMTIARARGYGIIVDAPGSVLNARDLSVVATAPDDLGSYGRALQVQLGAVATVERARFVDSREVAVMAVGVETSLTLRDALVDTIAGTACGPSCAAAGIGVGAYLDAHILMERFRVRRASLAGIQLALRAEVDLVDGEVMENLIGANVQVPGYEVARLTDRVSYRDNETNLDATSLPVPEITAPLPTP